MLIFTSKEDKNANDMQVDLSRIKSLWQSISVIEKFIMIIISLLPIINLIYFAYIIRKKHFIVKRNEDENGVPLKDVVRDVVKVLSEQQSDPAQPSKLQATDSVTQKPPLKPQEQTVNILINGAEYTGAQSNNGASSGNNTTSSSLMSHSNPTPPSNMASTDTDAQTKQSATKVPSNSLSADLVQENSQSGNDTSNQSAPISTNIPPPPPNGVPPPPPIPSGGIPTPPPQDMRNNQRNDTNEPQGGNGAPRRNMQDANAKTDWMTELNTVLQRRGKID